jgi:signal transduction histidine kinase
LTRKNLTRPDPPWPLRRRFAVAATAAGVTLAALSAFVVVSFVQVGQAQTRVTTTYFNTVRTAQALLTAYLDEETGVRGYTLTADPRFLEPYTRGLTEESAAAAELEGLVKDDPTLVTGLEELRAVAGRWRTEFAEPVIAQVRRGSAASITATTQDVGKRRFDRVRASYSSFEQAVLAARSTAVSDLSRGRTTLAEAFTALALLVVVALTGLGVAMRRWVLGPLDAVRADVRTVAEGNLDHRVQAIGPAELQQLAQDVESMREGLLSTYHRAVEATATVERQREVLVRQTNDLRRSNEELEQFAYVASHDLQEPLRKVASFTELLQRRYAGQLDERADSYIAFAADGARRMQALINDLLAFSRVGRVGVTRTAVPLDDALHRARTNLAATIEETGATIEAQPLPTVEGDPGLLTQVFQNLLANAIKFHRAGEAPGVRVTAEPDGDVWRIDVCDNGIGIDPQYADRVFVIFSRLNRREDYPGSGIGLALCRKIVEFHGGRIDVVPHGGTGTTIRFTLPSGQDRGTDRPAGTTTKETA